MAQSTVELLQFPYSHYNEKARWALDYKRVPHIRTSLLPGPHAVAIRRLTGQTQVPVLRIDGEVIAGSALIIDELERRHPEQPLYPADEALLRRALEIQKWFDNEVGPRVRRALFSIMLDEPGYVCRMFASQRSLPQRVLYRASFPLLKVFMKKGMGITDPASIDDAFRGTREALDFVAKEAGPDGCLVGDAFSVADLAAAALLAPTTTPDHPAMKRPEPFPDSIAQWLARWADHPGARWVLEQYRRHRPPSAEIPRRAG
jgi:glutathione S-transferase